jgi:hypothetical protein
MENGPNVAEDVDSPRDRGDAPGVALALEARKQHALAAFLAGLLHDRL